MSSQPSPSTTSLGQTKQAGVLPPPAEAKPKERLIPKIASLFTTRSKSQQQLPTVALPGSSSGLIHDACNGDGVGPSKMDKLG